MAGLVLRGRARQEFGGVALDGGADGGLHRYLGGRSGMSSHRIQVRRVLDTFGEAGRGSCEGGLGWRFLGAGVFGRGADVWCSGRFPTFYAWEHRSVAGSRGGLGRGHFFARRRLAPEMHPECFAVKLRGKRPPGGITAGIHFQKESWAMLSWKNLCLGAAMAASPLLMTGEARGDHYRPDHYRHGHYRPGCDVGRYPPSYRPSYHAGYRSNFGPSYRSSFGSSYRYGAGYGSGIGIGYTPRVYARPPIATPFGVPGGAFRYGAGYPRYGAGYPRYGTGGFSLYIGR